MDLPPAAPGGPSIVVNENGRTITADHLSEVRIDALLPARRFAGSATRRNKPTRPTLERLGRQLTVESDTEGIVAHLADSDAAVKRIITQPMWVRRHLDAESPSRRKCTWVCPDFLMELDSGDLLTVEVKRDGFELNDASTRKYQAVAEACSTAGSNYSLHTGLSQREREVFYLLHLHRRTRLLPTADVQAIRVQVLEAAAQHTTLEALWALGSRFVMQPVVWWMLWHGDLCMDWQKRIEPRTAIRMHGSSCSTVTLGTSAWDFKCGPHERTLIATIAQATMETPGPSRPHKYDPTPKGV